MISRKSLQDFLVPQRTLVARDRGTQHFRLTLGPVEIHRPAICVLGYPDPLGQLRTLA